MLKKCRHQNCHGDGLEGVLLTVALPGGREAVARLAVAAVAACSVDTLGVALAHRAVLTLIDICKQQRT